MSEPLRDKSQETLPITTVEMESAADRDKKDNSAA